MKQLIILFAFSFLYQFTNAQDCVEGEVLVVVELQTDIYGNETSWDIVNGQGVYVASGNNFENSTLYTDSLCVSESDCLNFTVTDEFGDGFSSPGYIKLYLDGEEITTITNYKASSSVNFNCAPGQSCSDAILKGEETFSFNPEGEWFKFVPSVNGIYKISTCDDAVCDTKIWVYDGCTSILIVEGHEGTSFYADDGDCGVQAEVSGVMVEGDEYYIRVRSEIDCQDDMLSISFVSPIAGCTDPTACNYNPLATVDDGSCADDPIDCPHPDLMMDVGSLRSSMFVRTETNNDPCLIQEGCMRGYGTRDIINFRTVIANIGDADYFIGEPESNPDQFDYDNCHNHYHYGGYAEYVLYDEYGQYIPIGFKNGFCVIDLSCPSQDMYQYSCNYMGISAGCTDIYDSYLACQWIDITDVPDGNYTFVTRVNWDNAPDALGQMERDTLNNWAQVCITLDRSSGNLTMEKVDDCDPYVDCLGNLYGKAEIDCKGECNGPALRGDIDEDGTLTGIDRNIYADNALEEIAATDCSDLNVDGKITVYDAAMLTNCMLYGASHVHEDGSTSHNHCTFPAGIYNHTTPTQWEISETNGEEEYFIVSMRNTASDVLAYQLKIEGAVVESIENLIDGFTAETVLRSKITNNIIVFSSSNSYIPKSATYNDILKVNISSLEGNEVCINVTEVVNANYEQVDASEPLICAPIQNVATVDIVNDAVKVYPNPFKNETLIQMETPADYSIKLYEASGKLSREESFYGDNILLKRNDLMEGVYFIVIQSDKVAYRSKLVIQ